MYCDMIAFSYARIVIEVMKLVANVFVVITRHRYRIPFPPGYIF